MGRESHVKLTDHIRIENVPSPHDSYIPLYLAHWPRTVEKNKLLELLFLKLNKAEGRESIYTHKHVSIGWLPGQITGILWWSCNSSMIPAELKSLGFFHGSWLCCAAVVNVLRPLLAEWVQFTAKGREGWNRATCGLGLPQLGHGLCRRAPSKLSNKSCCLLPS